MAIRHREEVLNTILAQVIVARGLNASPESIERGGTQRPDVIMNFRGLRCAVEGKIGDVADAKNVVRGDAEVRIETGIAQLAICAVYPKALRTTPFDALPLAMSKATLAFCLLTEHHVTGWEEGTVDNILAELRRAHELLSSDDVVRQAAEELSGRLTEVASVFMGDTAVCERLSDLLGMHESADGADEDAD